jgi:hypothetical protein
VSRKKRNENKKIFLWMKSESFWNHDDEKKKGAEEGAQ